MEARPHAELRSRASRRGTEAPLPGPEPLLPAQGCKGVLHVLPCSCSGGLNIPDAFPACRLVLLQPHP